MSKEPANKSYVWIAIAGTVGLIAVVAVICGIGGILFHALQTM